MLSTLAPWALAIIMAAGLGYAIWQGGKAAGSKAISDRNEAERNTAREKADKVERATDAVVDPITELYERDGRR